MSQSGFNPFSGDEALPRLVTTYKVAIPGFLAYRAVQFEHQTLRPLQGLPVNTVLKDAQFEELHQKWAPRALAMMLELRGFNLKSGQMVASNFGNVFPEV